MKAAIIGAAGMLGRKLAARLSAGELPGLRVLSLFDTVPPTPPPGVLRCECKTGSFAESAQAAALAAERPELIFHLAAIVSGEAERDVERGWAVNLQGTLTLLEALRAEHLASGGSYRPRLVFTSSIAVFGPPFPHAIDDDFIAAPQTSYGTQKAMAELAVADYSRKGFIDGISLRMPTVVVRPGAPNAAASGFFSAILREPLAGVEAILPVADSVRHWHVSPRTAGGFLVHAARLDTDRLGGRRMLNLPGVSCTVAEQIAALAAVAGADTAALIRRERDEAVAAIVDQWPQRFDASRAIALGFSADPDFESIIRIYLQDDAPRREST